MHHPATELHKFGGTVLVIVGMLWLFGLPFLMYWVGYWFGSRHVRKEAAEAGAGEWEVDPTTGETEFVWNESERADASDTVSGDAPPAGGSGREAVAP